MSMVIKATGFFIVFFLVIQLIAISGNGYSSYTINYGVLLFKTIVLAAGALLYFIPSFVAHHRGHHQMMPIFLLNLFLGWSLLGWVAALVWATVALNRGRDNA